MDEAPTLRGRMLLGSIPDLRRDPLGTYERVLRDCGDIGRLVLGPPGLRLVLHVVSHPDGIRRVLATASGSYGKDLLGYREIRALGGNGLLTSEGEQWRHQRRSLQPLFTPRHVAAYTRPMVEEAQGVVERWSAAAARSQPVDLHREMLAYALRVLGRALFGRGVDDALPVLAAGLPVVGAYVARRANAPVRLPRSWPTPANRGAQRARAALYGVVDGLVASRRAADSPGEDLIGSLLRARDPETGLGLDDAEIRDQVLIFLMAGHETTATALTFTLHLLGLHPDVQERVRSEAEEVLRARRPTAEDAPALTYTAMVVKEALRLYPSAHLLARAATHDDVVLGRRIAEGATLIVMPWLAHRHPAFWPNPERFDPSRFTSQQEKERHRYAYIPFGGGPRACIGASFATLETVLATAIIVRAHRLRTVPGPVPLVADFTIRPAQPVPATAEPLAVPAAR